MAYGDGGLGMNRFEEALNLLDESNIDVETLFTAAACLIAEKEVDGLGKDFAGPVHEVRERICRKLLDARFSIGYNEVLRAMLRYSKNPAQWEQIAAAVRRSREARQERIAEAVRRRKRKIEADDAANQAEA